MEFVDFDIAKKLKEKGFKEKCIAYYWENINEHTPSFVVEDNMPEDGICLLELISEHNKAEWSPFIDAPTISQVLMWLRKEHNLYVCPTLNTYRGNRKKDKAYNLWMFQIKNIANNHLIYPHPLDMDDVYETYEQAALAGIEYVLDNLI